MKTNRLVFYDKKVSSHHRMRETSACNLKRISEMSELDRL